MNTIMKGTTGLAMKKVLVTEGHAMARLTDCKPLQYLVIKDYV